MDTLSCLACAEPLKAGDPVYNDVGGGFIHAACCGPERECYVGDDGEPLKDGEPIPEPWLWTEEPALRGRHDRDGGGAGQDDP